MPTWQIWKLSISLKFSESPDLHVSSPNCFCNQQTQFFSFTQEQVAWHQHKYRIWIQNFVEDNALMLMWHHVQTAQLTPKRVNVYVFLSQKLSWMVALLGLYYKWRRTDCWHCSKHKAVLRFLGCFCSIFVVLTELWR